MRKVSTANRSQVASNQIDAFPTAGSGRDEWDGLPHDDPELVMTVLGCRPGLSDDRAHRFCDADN